MATKFTDISLTGSLNFISSNSQSSKITSSSDIIIDPSGIGDNTGIVTINGDLVVLGKQTTISSESLEISDNIITLNKGYNNSGPNNFTSGIEIENNTNNKPQLLWVNDANSWKFIKSNTNELLNLELNNLELNNFDVSGYIHNTNDISYNVNISGNFIPTSDNNYSLGDNTKGWSDLYKDGSIYLQNKRIIYFDGNILKFSNPGGDITVPDNFNVLGTTGLPTQAQSNATITSGVIYNTVIGINQGNITPKEAYFTFIDVLQNSTFQQDLSVNQKLKVGSDVSLNDNVDISNHLTVNGDVSLNDNVDISNHLTVNSDVSLNDNVDISNHLTVLGDVSLNDNVDISNHLTVNGDVSLNDNVDISNHLTVNGDVSLNDNVDISNHLTVKW